MPASSPRSLLHKVWEYPLFEALYGRRSRRFGLGFEMAEGPFKYKSQRAPVALTDIEEALLVAAGVGFSGIALWDQSRPLPYRAGDGRTFPSTSRGRRTALFFTNDQGVYVIAATASTATSRARGEGFLASFRWDKPKDHRDHRGHQLSSRRPMLPMTPMPSLGA
jgi:hypothetical protein